MDTAPLTITFVGYEIRGVAEVSLWGGGIKPIQMRPFMTDDPSRPNLLKCLNSNDVEVEWINGAICHIHGVWADEWGNKLKRFYQTLTVGKVSRSTKDFREEIFT